MSGVWCTGSSAYACVIVVIDRRVVALFWPVWRFGTFHTKLERLAGNEWRASRMFRVCVRRPPAAHRLGWARYMLSHARVCAHWVYFICRLHPTRVCVRARITSINKVTLRARVFAQSYTLKRACVHVCL